MNSIFLIFRIASLRSNWRPRKLAVAGVIFSLGLGLLALSLPAQNDNVPTTEFKQLVERLSQARLDGTVESEADQQKALGFLDSMAVMLLSASSSPDLDAANRRLSSLVTHDPPVGENYRLVPLGGTPVVYAQVVNFGLGGPAAVRVYANIDGHYALAGKIDRFSQTDFFDSDIELIRMPATDKIFVTVSGRTDDLQTGIFSAWHFEGRQITRLWTSDLLQQSSYEMDADGFHVTYCATPAEERPSQCLKMARDTYRFQNGEWKRVETH